MNSDTTACNVTTGARLLPNLQVSADGRMNVTLSTNLVCADVTGGMRTKVQNAVNIVQGGRGVVTVHVCDVMSTEFLFLCLHGNADGNNWSKIEFAS